MTQTFYVIFDKATNKYKGQPRWGRRWTKNPTRMYRTEGIALGALKQTSGVRKWIREERRTVLDFGQKVVLPITVTIGE